jgi:hypothetical protein
MTMAEEDTGTMLPAALDEALVLTHRSDTLNEAKCYSGFIHEYSNRMLPK